MSISPLADNLVKVTLAGRLDAAAVDRIETRFVASIVPDGRSAIVDLSQVDFVASLGIRMLVGTARSLQMKQAKFALYGLQDPVNELFDGMLLSQLVAICATESDALAAVGVSPSNA
jgi:anti-anti-sigma factor